LFEIARPSFALGFRSVTIAGADVFPIVDIACCFDEGGLDLRSIAVWPVVNSELKNGLYYGLVHEPEAGGPLAGGLRTVVCRHDDA